MNIINSKHYKSINNIISEAKGYNEKELDLNRNKKDINYEIYLKLIKFLFALNGKEKNKYKIENSQVIDCSYSIKDKDNLINYRITINNELISDCLNKFKSNYKDNIFKKLLYTIKQNNNKNISIIKKSRNNKYIYDFDDYNIRFRCNKEESIDMNEISKLITEINKNSKISFRLKKRISLFTNNIRIDLTDAIYSNTFNFENKSSSYELEIEFKKFDKEEINSFIIMFLKNIQHSNHLITLSEINDINIFYNKLFNKQNITNIKIDAMNVVSLGIKDLDVLENKYAVTDKADGEHAFMIVYNENIYIITQYFHIKNVGMKVNKKYNGTIFDGEALFINKKYLFMAFDCLFYCGDDIRNENLLLKRLEYINKFCKENFKYEHFKYLENAKNIDEVNKYYSEEFIKFNKQLTQDLKSNNFILRPKFFMKVYGFNNNEIYVYSKTLWNNYNLLSKNGNYPYLLDGMVYQPINQIYTLKSRQQIYKWKPYYQNSIDFYLEFRRDKDNNILKVFHKTQDEEVILLNENNNDSTTIKKYQIANLYVGKKNKDDNNEIPILFSPKLNNPDNDIHIIYIPINENGYCVDKEGNVINDKTVVECYYDETDEKYFRWKVIRTRYDKTENVMNFHKKYGNYDTVADNIWNTIKYPIKFEDIIDLASDNYVNTKDKLINLNPIKSNDAYYTVDYDIRNAVDNKVNFHNMIKTQLINCYCGPHNGKKMSIFDPAIGKGKDIFNYYNAHVKSVIGMDLDFAGLHSINGTFQKYKNIKNKPGVPFMDFIQGDFTVDLNANLQNKVISNISDYNTRAMNKYFNWKFDVISCHFAFHYFLENENRLQTTINNMNKLLNNGGYVILTLFDGQEVHKYLGDNNEVENYIDVKGIRTLIHKITKKYDINDKNKVVKNGNKIMFKCGNAIDVYVGEGGISRIEYLVDKDYLIDKMKENNFDLVETLSFEEVFNNYRQYVNEVSLVETKPDMKKYLDKLKRYYEDNESNKECFKITRLNRYYVFKKK